jgi:hypothetical protein
MNTNGFVLNLYSVIIDGNVYITYYSISKKDSPV